MVNGMSGALSLDNPFWRFSLRVYAREDVRKECLSLQEAHGLDVNLLLFVAWLAAERGVSIDEAAVAVIEDFASRWHAAVVLPLRGVRKDVKEMSLFAREEIAAFRRKVAAVELDSEQIEQALLFEWAEKHWPTPGASSSVSANIAAYLARFSAAAGAPALTRAAQG
jgi:uncharacterized protein (TIGR02444 family)